MSFFIRLIIANILLMNSFHMEIQASSNHSYPFEVRQIFTSAQKDTKGYYHIDVNESDIIELQALVTNVTNNPLTLEVRAVNAYSGHNGILYQQDSSNDNYYATDRFIAFNQITNVMDTISLDPKSSEIVTFTVHVPKNENGTILGGIKFVLFEGSDLVEDNESSDQNATLLVDKYKAITIAVQLDYPNLDQAQVTIPKVNIDNTDASVVWNVENKSSRIQKDINWSYKVKSEDGKILFEGSVNSVKMAPNTGVFLKTPWGADTLEPGDYQIIMDMVVEGNKQTLHKSLIVEKETIKKIVKHQQANEQQSKLIVKTSSSYWIWIVITILLILIVGWNLKLRKQMKQLKSSEE